MSRIPHTAKREQIANLDNHVNSLKRRIDTQNHQILADQAKHSLEVKKLNEVHDVILEAAYRDHAAFLDNLLLLEPHLKHYQTDGKWDTARIYRAANHLRGEQALESVGYTHQEPDFSNVTFVDFHAPDPEGAA